MSLQNIVDVIIHFDTFRNIDLYKRGLYYYQLHLFHTQRGEKTVAAPYTCYVQDSSLPKSRIGSPGLIEDQYYKTKTINIRYCDEDIEIKEIVIFRIEVNAGQELPEITVSCSLMYNESAASLFPRPEDSGFVEETTVDISINTYLRGINQFVPILFDEGHCCVMNTTMHVLPFDFRFRHSAEELGAGFNIFSTIAECLFEKSTIVQEDDVALVQNQYVKSLHTVYQKNIRCLKEWVEYAQNDNSVPDSIFVSNDFEESLPHVHKINSTDPSIIAEALMAQVHLIAEQLTLLEFKLINVLLQYPGQVCHFLMIQYNDLLKDYWGESIFRSLSVSPSFTPIGTQSQGKNHKNIAKKVRKSEYYCTLQQLPITIKSFLPKPKHHPIIFLDIFSKVAEDKMMWKKEWIHYTRSTNNSMHLIVFVHGFQGTNFDMRGIRNQVALLRSDTMLLCSVKNEEKTEEGILDMGRRLAAEVLQFIDDWCAQVNVTRVSFVGHSLGGIIIRAALPYLQELSEKCCFLMTFSSAHLGYMYNSSTIVDAGMWLIKKFKKSQSMKELMMADNPLPEETFLYKLSETPGIEWFKHIALVGSFQDNYAPYESARIMVGPEAENDSKGRLYIKMAENILNRVKADKIHRIDVDFKIRKKNIDSMIGRAAHIQMLDNRVLINMILHCCASFFEV